jgi:hypothetical protein
MSVLPISACRTLFGPGKHVLAIAFGRLQRMTRQLIVQLLDQAS